MSFDSSRSCLQENDNALALPLMQRMKLSDWMALTKLRLSVMSVITAIFGYLSAPSAVQYPEWLVLILATAFSATGAAVLNQWMERDHDAKMKRTQDRPLPSGILSPNEAWWIGLGLSTVGVFLLLASSYYLASALLLATLLLYLLVYTPMKRKSHWNTLVGAIPGALPPLIGWTVAEQNIGIIAVVLFGILFLWQMPHFMSISWIHREDYAKAGFCMLSRWDPSGARVAMHSVVFTLAMTFTAALPVFTGHAGTLYAYPCALLHFVMLFLAWRFLTSENKLQPAKHLFFATLIYLPIYYTALIAGLHFQPLLA